MTIETITAFLYVWLTISLAFPVLAIWLIMRAKRLKNELKKQSHANKYYEENALCLQRGYLTCSYYKNKEYQYCSRRLATLLNLKNGENSTLAEVLSIFDRKDAEKINAFFMGLNRNGLSFETIVKTKSKNYLPSPAHG